MTRLLTAILMALGLTSTATAQPSLSVGQMWTIKDPPAEKTRVIIGRIDGDTIHVSVLFVPTPPNYPIPETPIGHMPFQRAAVEASLVKMVSAKADLPDDFEQGFDNWRTAKGGVFSISISEAIDAVLEALIQGKQETAVDAK